MILVTGGTGLVGAHLLMELVKNEPKVRAIYRSEVKIVQTKSLFRKYQMQDYFHKIVWIKADILDLTDLEYAFEDIDRVYHCAAMISFEKKDYPLMRKVNIEGTANMVNLSISYGVKKFCFVSSIAAVEKNPYGGPTDEKEDWNQEKHKNGYAITKYGAEMEVWRGSQEGLEVAIVNPGVIIGPGFFRQGSGRLYFAVYNGMKFYTSGRTGYVGVWDVVKSLIGLMNSDIHNERYILVAQNLSYREVFTDIANSIGVKPPKNEAKPWMLKVGWRLSLCATIFTGKKPSLSKGTSKSAFKVMDYSSDKIKNSPLNFSFEPMKEVFEKTGKMFNPSAF